MHFSISPRYDADVLIAGGGPAGATCAYYLARAGYDVILVDSQAFPRDKVCGDFVGPLALKELEKMSITTAKDFQKTNIIKQASVFLDGVPVITKQIPQVDDLPNYGRVIPRERLDNWILEAARREGVRVVTPYRLQNFNVYNNSVVSFCRNGESDISFTTRLIVGADGSSSVVARILNGRKPDPMDRILAVRAYFENINCNEGQAELYFTSKSFPGYYWLFPTGPAKANVGVGMVLENFPQKQIGLKDLLLDLINTDETLKQKIGNGKLKDKVVGWPLSTYNPDNALVSERLMLAGDAAGLINSLNGEGIQYAMQSGRLAAQTLINCLQSGDLSLDSLKKYEKAIKHHIGYDMSLSNFVIQFIRNRNLNPLWLKLLTVMVERAKKDKDYATIASGILAGLVPANKALSLSFFSKTALQGVDTMFSDIKSAVSKGPVTAAAMGINLTTFALSQIAAAINQRRDYWKWSKGIIGESFHLSGYIANDIRQQVVTYPD